MDTLKDFFSDLKDRISNPSISSFIISWLIINYKITVGLLFYKIGDLSKYHKTTYLDLVTNENNIYHIFWIPFGIALFYTFMFPFIKAGIRIFNMWLLMKTDGTIFRITKNEVVSVEEYINKSSELSLTKAQYVQSINSSKDLDTEIQSLKSDLTTRSKDYENKLLEIKKSHDERIADLSKTYEERIDSIQDQEDSQLTTLRHDLTEAVKELSAAKTSITKLEALKRKEIDTIKINNDIELTSLWKKNVLLRLRGKWMVKRTSRSGVVEKNTWTINGEYILDKDNKAMQITTLKSTSDYITIGLTNFNSKKEFIINFFYKEDKVINYLLAEDLGNEDIKEIQVIRILD